MGKPEFLSPTLRAIGTRDIETKSGETAPQRYLLQAVTLSVTSPSAGCSDNKNASSSKFQNFIMGKYSVISTRHEMRKS
jgi:hypothetical protein